jgi:3-oxoadipate enol-lactonase
VFVPHVRSGLTDVWWDSTGDGEPILLINGFSSPSAVWFRLVPLLTEHHRVLTFDNLGTGRTGVPSTPWTIEDMAEAAAAVIVAAEEASAAVLGMSMGGLIAQQLALSHSELVSRLVLVSTHPGIDLHKGDDAAVAALGQVAAKPIGEQIDSLSKFVYGPATSATDIAEDFAVRSAHPTDPAGTTGQMQAMQAWPSRLPELSAIRCPTLVLHGQHDKLVFPECGKQLSESIPGARMTVLPGAGHQLFTDEPSLGSRAVLEFLRS